MILITPIQRGPRYELLLKDLVKILPKNNIIKSLLDKSKSNIKKFNLYCEELDENKQSYRKSHDKEYVKCMNLYDTYNNNKQLHNILPSYCDRIIFKRKTSNIYDFNPIEYNSFYDDMLDTAEHNMIYGKFNLKYNYDNMIKNFKSNLNIIYISFNNSKFSEKIDMEALLNNMNKQMSILGNDIVILALQDIQNYNKSKLKEKLLFDYLNDQAQKYTLIVDKFKGSPSSQIGLFVYIKSQLMGNDQNKLVIDNKNEECFKLICKRSYVGYTLKFLYKNYVGITSEICFNIINTHLSFDPDDNNLGFNERKEQLLKIIKYLNKINEKQTDYINILGGDLNFRLKSYSDNYDELYSDPEINNNLYLYFEPYMREKGILGKIPFNEMPFNPTCVFQSKEQIKQKQPKKHYQQNDLLYKAKYLKYKQKYLQLKNKM